MKLSEAIRKGCKIARRQTTGKLFEWNEKTSKLEAACVLGAAILGSCPEIKIEVWFNIMMLREAFKAKFPVLFKQFKNPKDHNQEELIDILVHLNDDWNWKRYQIARWLECQGL